MSATLDDVVARLDWLIELLADKGDRPGPLTPAERAKRYRQRHGKRDEKTVTKRVTERDDRHGKSDVAVSVPDVTDRHEARDEVGGKGGRSWNGRSETLSRDSSKNERERSREASRHETRDAASVTRLRTVTPTVTPGERYIRLDETLTDELRSIAEMASVQDIKGAWTKFAGNYADKWIHVAGRWQVWCANEAKRERLEREQGRDRGRRGPVRAGEESYSPPPVTRAFEPAAGELRAKGLDPSDYGIDPTAPDLGTARTHPLKRQNDNR